MADRDRKSDLVVQRSDLVAAAKEKFAEKRKITEDNTLVLAGRLDSFKAAIAVFGAPPNFTVFVDQNKVAHLKWGVPQNVLTDQILAKDVQFEIAYHPEGGSITSWLRPNIGINRSIIVIDPQKPIKAPLVTMYTDIDFDASKMHTFYVRAVSATGKRNFLGPAAAFTLKLPSAPQYPYAYSTGSYNIRVSWVPPVEVGGTDIIRYEIMYYELSDWEATDAEIQEKIAAATWQGTTSAYYSNVEMPGSTALGIPVQFRIRAVSVLGAGAVATCTAFFYVIN